MKARLSIIALALAVLATTASAGICPGAAAGAHCRRPDQDCLGRCLHRSRGATIPAQAGQPVFEADTLRTGADGRVGVTLKDDTRLSLGRAARSASTVSPTRRPKAGSAFVLNVVRGVAAYVSGRIAKLAPDAVRLETPAAIVGVRGTTVVIRASQE